MIVTCRQMKDAEEAAFAKGATAASLMEQAGAGIAEALYQYFPEPGTAVLYLGKGNNAGDALVTARDLLASGWEVYARLAFNPTEFSELPAALWDELQTEIRVIGNINELSHFSGTILLLDGLVGINANVPLRDSLAEMTREMNAFRSQRHAQVIALDIPSGLSVLNGEAFEPCVEADITITIGQVKSVLLADTATRFVGRLVLVELRALSFAQSDATQRALSPSLLLPTLPTRPFDNHKGDAGRVGIIAGSRGYLGAAQLASLGALRGGAGLVTLYVKDDIYALIAARTAPEVMVKCVKDYREALRDPINVLAIGPGLGLEYEDEILALISRADIPLVLDADALNMFARRGLDALKKNMAPRLLTPHPGEMERLAERMPDWRRMSRVELAKDVPAKFPNVTLLLKGSRTVVSAIGQPFAFNTTGHPGMATGGIGDVLTGLCAALIGQGMSVYDAACLGSWINGRAAELAIYRGYESAESLTASSVLDHIGAAFQDLRSLSY